MNSRNAALFRRWANSVLKEYLMKGYSVNQRLNQLEQRVSRTEEKIDFFVRTSLPPVEGILMLSKRNAGVKADIYTQTVNHQLQLDLQKHTSQYPPIDIHTCRKCHDRFMIIDSEEIWHIGASLKDLGKKMFAFSRLNIPAEAVMSML